MFVALARLGRLSLLSRVLPSPRVPCQVLSLPAARDKRLLSVTNVHRLDRPFADAKFMTTDAVDAGSSQPAVAGLEKRAHDGEDADVATPAEKRQKADEGDSADTPNTEGKSGESSETKGDQAPRKNKYQQMSRKAARERRQEMTHQQKRRGTRPEGEEAPDNGEPKGPRLPKRMSAVLMGFCGAGYNGMQVQKDVRTIEGTLFNAMVKVGAVSQDNADDPVKVSLNRAARTDAGVHAAGNLVSIKLITRIPGVPDVVASINEQLPPEIRVWKIIRVQNSFNARTHCDSRKYTYYFPSYLLLPPKPGSGLQNTLTEQSGSPSSHPFWDGVPEDSSPADDLLRKRQWRALPEAVQSLRDIVQRYEGSHNFHNFTIGREFSDRSTSRFMKKIEVTDPVVYGETEWISVLFHGQSFMLHQRKMMAALILVARTGTPAGIIDELYGPRMLFVPKMPALGLLLEFPIFESYNRKVKESNGQMDTTNPEFRPLIEFDALKEQMEQFKQDFIYSRMRSIEDRDGVFDSWVRSIDKYTGTDLLYLNPKGVIPTKAVIERGVRRANPFREKKRFDATSFPEGQRPAGQEEEEDEEEEQMGKLDKKALADMEG